MPLVSSPVLEGQSEAVESTNDPDKGSGKQQTGENEKWGDGKRKEEKKKIKGKKKKKISPWSQKRTMRKEW